ncbi:MAG: zinc-ribbon domain-containing protein [Clostridia bacterium]|nr:zinc-ribbon domain-containing protein [Clostridia bacterium]
MAFCTNCGNKLVEGAKFCTNCGKAINVTVAPKSSATVNTAVQPEQRVSKYDDSKEWQVKLELERMEKLRQEKLEDEARHRQEKLEDEDREEKKKDFKLGRIGKGISAIGGAVASAAILLWKLKD